MKPRIVPFGWRGKFKEKSAKKWGWCGGEGPDQVGEIKRLKLKPFTEHVLPKCLALWWVLLGGLQWWPTGALPCPLGVHHLCHCFSNFLSHSSLCMLECRFLGSKATSKWREVKSYHLPSRRGEWEYWLTSLEGFCWFQNSAPLLGIQEFLAQSGHLYFQISDVNLLLGQEIK